MINRIILITILGIFLSCQNKQNSDNKLIQNTIDLTDSLTKELKEIKKKSIIPGFSVAIFNDEKVIYKKGFGY